MKKLMIVASAMTLILNSGVVLSNDLLKIPHQLMACKGLTNNTERLSCFDKAVENAIDQVSLDESTKQPSELAIAAKPAQSITQITNQPELPNQAQKKKELVASNSPKKSNFGMEFANQDEKVETFIIGKFKGWKKGLKLKLKNGQVWKVTSAPSGYRKMDNPAITISRGFFGSFDAKVEGLNARAKVKRLK